MPKGCALIGWDNTIGSIIEAKFPEDLEIDFTRITQYLTTLQNLSSSRIIQIHDGEDVALIFGFPVQSQMQSYDFIVTFLDDTEKDKISQVQLQYHFKGEKILKSTGTTRTQRFTEFAYSIFQPVVKKIIFMGCPNAGKTSTKKFLFEKIRSENLLETSLLPTQGYDTSHYDILDLQIALFDTSGQEIDRWYESDESVLIDSDLIVFFLTLADWKEKAEKISQKLAELAHMSKKVNRISQNIVIFCHKSDLNLENENKEISEIKNAAKRLQLPIFFTSIKNGGNQDILIAMQLIVEKLSSLIIFLNELITPLIYQDISKPFFLMDKNNEIISKFTTPTTEFQEVDKIRKYFLKNLANYTQIYNKSGEFHILNSNSINLLYLCLNISYLHPELTYLILKVEKIENLEILIKIYRRLRIQFKYNHEI